MHARAGGLLCRVFPVRCMKWCKSVSGDLTMCDHAMSEKYNIGNGQKSHPSTGSGTTRQWWIQDFIDRRRSTHRQQWESGNAQGDQSHNLQNVGENSTKIIWFIGGHIPGVLRSLDLPLIFTNISETLNRTQQN